ncbi:hypothetical protein O3G_MSEX014995 [Manduca sexta]|uniref:Uncharacterized protein n=1 Tax=Manduca sexta TaxID=7130 RepID=A0A922D0H3_MANSE|nr:hypothetical protein O3G_MSEX014995 [Manduca sexta]KAG6465199.1 hypothetical protein O3G_MSEX014995 [Manduca sexta]
MLITETSPPSPLSDEKESKMSQIQFSPPFDKQESTIWQKRQQAVCVRHAFKHYGSNKRPNHVLSNLNMTVAKGTMLVQHFIAFACQSFSKI